MATFSFKFSSDKIGITGKPLEKIREENRIKNELNLGRSLKEEEIKLINEQIFSRREYEKNIMRSLLHTACEIDRALDVMGECIDIIEQIENSTDSLTGLTNKDMERLRKAFESDKFKREPGLLYLKEFVKQLVSPTMEGRKDPPVEEKKLTLN